MNEEKVVKKKILNPTVDELNEKLNLKNSNSIPKSKDSTVEPFNSPLESNIKEIENTQLKEMSMGKIKPQESVFAPKPFPFKLICGKHNYLNMDNIDDDGVIYVRKMSSKEENIFYENTQNMTIEKFNNIITQVLTTCVRSNIDVNKLYSIEKLPLFIFILSLTYESKRNFTMNCEICQSEQIKEKDLKNLTVKYFPEDLIIPMPIELNSYGYPINLLLHYPTIEEEETFSNEDLDITTRIRYLVDKITGVLPSGEEITEEYYDDIMTYMDKNDIKKIRDAFNTIKDYGIDLSESFICDNKKCSAYKLTQNQSLDLQDIFKIIYE